MYNQPSYFGELCPLALCRPYPHFPHPRLPRGGRPPRFPYPKEASLLRDVIGDDISELDAHLAHAPMRPTTMGIDPGTKRASLILMSSVTGKLGH